MSILTHFTIVLSFIYFINAFKMKLIMPGVSPASDDQYICAPFPVAKPNVESFITAYEPVANSSIAHHILLFGCISPYSTESSYSCTSICDNGQEKILFGWAKDAQKFEYPTDTGMSVGGKTDINYFVLQVHYLKKSILKDNSGLILTLTDEPPKYSVGIFLLFSYYGIIPPRKSKAHLDISCKYQGNNDAYTLAFRTHTHALGRSISGFKVSVTDDQIELIGKGNPQWPQTFYKASQVLIKPGDILMARCVFDSRSTDVVTNIGNTHHDEMCNFYIMLVNKYSDEGSNFLTCGGDEFKDLWKNIPSYSMDYDSENPSPDLRLTKSSLSNYDNTIKSLKADENWKVNFKLGDVSGVSILPNKNSYTLFVLHRGSHKWTESTFSDNVYQGESSKAITDYTILEIDPPTGNVLRKAGNGFFYMPHGITVTKDGQYVWVTDVALHQVMQFKLRQDSQLINEQPNIILGERFVPGNDRNHFCKPADVAIDSRGYIFVADGYCNKRVLLFSPNGTYIDEWRVKHSMFIVHSITIEEDKAGDLTKNVVWVADRENRKLIGFNYDGSIKSRFSSDDISLPIYGIEFNPSNKLIYGISSNGNDRGKAFTFNTATFSKGKSWNSNYPLQAPHDLCLAEKGNTIYVAEIHLQRIIKFHLDNVPKSNPILISKNYVHINEMVKNINPTLIGISLFSVMLFIILCIVAMKYYRRCLSGNGKIRRYGHSFKDKEGFRPLTQDDDANDDGNSDPETEEYSTPRGNPLRKPKV